MALFKGCPRQFARHRSAVKSGHDGTDWPPLRLPLQINDYSGWGDRHCWRGCYLSRSIEAFPMLYQDRAVSCDLCIRGTAWAHWR
jgi:hypothetical protein